VLWDRSGAPTGRHSLNSTYGEEKGAEYELKLAEVNNKFVKKVSIQYSNKDGAIERELIKLSGEMNL
jgi:hypothetical protein